MFKNFKVLLFAVFLIVSVFFVSACSYSNTNDGAGNTYGGNINGFKVNFRPEFFQVDDFYYAFSKQMITTLAGVFGSADFDFDSVEEIESLRTKKVLNGTEISVVPFIFSYYEYYLSQLNPEDTTMGYKNFEDGMRVYFIDDIRNSVMYQAQSQTYFSQTLTQNSWNWSHLIEINLENTHGYVVKNSINQTDTVLNEETDLLLEEVFSKLEVHQNEFNNYYLNFYADELYAQALQVAILQMLLERTPTTFTFDYNTNSILPNPENLLGDNISQGLKYEYQKYAQYVGISENDKIKITNYLLDKVIGSNKYNNQNNYFTRNQYEFIIEEVVWNGTLKQFYFSNESLQQQNSAELGSIYQIYPTTYLLDFPSNEMFVTNEDDNAFEHLPKGEIKSVILMSGAESYIYEMWFYLAANSKFNVNIHYRFYDANSNTLFESQVGVLETFIESDFNNYETQHIAMNFEDVNGNEALYKATPFNNDIGEGILQATEEKRMNYEISQYFEQSGQGGLGLSYEMFQQDHSSFFEIVFNIVKPENQQNEDFSFKVGFLAIMFVDKDFLN